MGIAQVIAGGVAVAKSSVYICHSRCFLWQASTFIYIYIYISYIYIREEYNMYIYIYISIGIDIYSFK